MKRFLMVCLLLAVVSPALAIFCQECGKGIPEDARFCPACGKRQGESPRPPTHVEAPPPPPAAPVAVAPAPPLTPAPVHTALTEEFMRGYEPIEELELLLTASSFQTVARRSLEQRSRMALNLPAQERLARGRPVLSKMHELQVSKLATLERYLDSWKAGAHGSVQAQPLAQRDKDLFVLGRLNEMITTLTVGTDVTETLERVRELENDLEKTSREYVVTSPFLEVGNQRLQRHDRIWVPEVKNGQCRILHMGPSASPLPVAGWVPVSSLDKRSTWRYESSLLTVPQTVTRTTTVVEVPTTVIYQPAPQPPTTVIVIGKHWCRRCGYFSCRCHRHRSPYPTRYPRGGGGPRRRDDGRRPHIVIEPRFW